MLRVAITSSDTEGCGTYRVRHVAQALADQGEIDLIDYEEIKLTCRNTSTGAVEVVALENPPECDVLIMQRIMVAQLVEAIRLFRKAGVAVVMDLDDDMERMAPDHVQFGVYDPRRNNAFNWKLLKQACNEVDLLTVSTPALCRYAPHGRVEVVRNCVPASYLDMACEPSSAPLTVGWGGTVFSHPGDLNVTHGGVAAAVREENAGFRVVGTADDVRRALALEEEPQETGIVALADYMCEIAQLDVGIAPLREDSYTAAKSWLKILEYSAVGVPWVASAMPEYELFHQVAPAGFLAKDRARDWRRGVLQLLQSEALREEFAQAGWEAVRENFLIEENAWRWLEAWEDALVNYHERSAARSGSLSNGNR